MQTVCMTDKSLLLLLINNIFAISHYSYTFHLDLPLYNLTNSVANNHELQSKHIKENPHVHCYLMLGLVSILLVAGLQCFGIWGEILIDTTMEIFHTHAQQTIMLHSIRSICWDLEDVRLKIEIVGHKMSENILTSILNPRPKTQISPWKVKSRCLLSSPLHSSQR